jgi:hypothetical protein
MKHLFGLAAFVLAIALGIGLTTYFRPRPSPPSAPLPPPTPESPPPPAGASAQTIGVKVRQVVLDRAKKVSIVTVELVKASGPPPSAVWLTTYYIVPSSGRVLPAEPIAVPWPSPGTMTVNATARAPWVGTPDDPGSGYVARVVASTVRVDPDPSQVDAKPVGAAQVTVLGSNKPR